MWGFSDQKNMASDSRNQEVDSALADLSQAAETVKSKRRQRLEGAQAGPDLSRLAQQAQELFKPEAWRPIVRAPFELGRMQTGHDHWSLTKSEEDTLATSSATTAEYFLQVDPKWVAMTLFMFNWGATLTTKIAQERQANLAEQKYLHDDEKKE